MHQQFDFVFVLSAILWVPSLMWKIKVLDNNNQTTTPNTTFTKSNASKSSSVDSDDVTVGVGVTLATIVVIGTVLMIIVIIVIMKRKKVNFQVICQRSGSNSTGSGADDGVPMTDGNAKQD